MVRYTFELDNQIIVMYMQWNSHADMSHAKRNSYILNSMAEEYIDMALDYIDCVRFVPSINNVTKFW